MKSGEWVRLLVLAFIILVDIGVGILLGLWLVGLIPFLGGTLGVLLVSCATLLLGGWAFALALPSSLRFVRCGTQHLVGMLGDMWPALLLLSLTAIALTVYRHTPPPSPTGSDCPPPDKTTSTSVVTPVPKKELVSDVKEVSTDLLFDFNQSSPYSKSHATRMDEYLTELFADYNDIKITKIVALTDPIGSEKSNVNLANARGEYIRAALVRIATSPKLASQFPKAEIPAAVVAGGGPNSGDFAFWKQCFDRFYIQRPNARPLEDLERRLAGNRIPCSLSSVDDGKDGNYPACRRVVVGDAGRTSTRAFAQRLENLRELTACLAPMRRVIVWFKRAPLPPRPGERASEPRTVM